MVYPLKLKTYLKVYKIMNEKNVILKKYLLLIVSSLASGIFIGLGGFANVVASSYQLKFLGAFLFSIGLFLVCTLKSKLYTGQIGFVIENKHKFIALELFIMLIFNLLGAILIGYLLSFAFLNNQDIANSINTIVSSRIGNIANTWYKSLISSVICGLFVFLAVYFYKFFDNYFAKIFSLVFCVTIFVYIGAEHCIANMFYFAFANSFDVLNCFYNLLLTIVGNSIGAILTYLLVKCLSYKLQKNEVKK